MSLSRWLCLVAVMVGVGCLQVAQRNAVILKGYALGEQMAKLHAQQTNLSWLNVHVAELTSPTYLSRVAQDRQLKLAGWSLASSIPSLDAVSLAPRQSRNARQDERSRHPFVHIAEAKPISPATDHDTSD